MTIDYLKYYIECPRFAFGVPLEDIFLNGKVHPCIEGLFDLTYNSILNCDYPVETILSQFQGSLTYRLGLKAKFLRSTPNYKIQAYPGAFLWLIRHFLGLLPLQLIPNYADGEKFSWWKLSIHCRKNLIDKHAQNNDNASLINKIANDVARLPIENINLISRFVKFCRQVITCPYYKDQHLQKAAAFALVRYFTSSLFVRPFRPGFVAKSDKQFHPILMYFIVKWPSVEKVYLKLQVSQLHKSILVNKTKSSLRGIANQWAEQESTNKFQDIVPEKSFERTKRTNIQIPEDIFETISDDLERDPAGIFERNSAEICCEGNPEDIFVRTPEGVERTSGDNLEKTARHNVRRNLRDNFEGTPADKFERTSSFKRTLGGTIDDPPEKTPIIESYSDTQLKHLDRTLIRLVPYVYYYDTDEFLRDSCCQTDIRDEDDVLVTEKVFDNASYTYDCDEGNFQLKTLDLKPQDNSYVNYDEINLDFDTPSNSMTSNKKIGFKYSEINSLTPRQNNLQDDYLTPKQKHTNDDYLTPREKYLKDDYLTPRHKHFEEDYLTPKQKNSKQFYQSKVHVYKRSIEEKKLKTFEYPNFLVGEKDKKKGIYGWVYSNPSDLSDFDNDSSSPMFQENEEDIYHQNYVPTFNENDGYLYDEYSQFQFPDEKSTQNLLNQKDVSVGTAPNEKEGNNNLVQRISKMGWTYSSKTKDKINLHEGINKQDKTLIQHKTDVQGNVKEKNTVGGDVQDLNGHSKRNADAKDNYKIVFTQKESAQVEEKEQSSIANIEIAPCSTEIDVIKNSKNKMGLSISKMTSKLDFRKMFSHKKELKNIASADQLPSKIRYKKMDCSKSSIF